MAITVVFDTLDEHEALRGNRGHSKLLDIADVVQAPGLHYGRDVQPDEPARYVLRARQAWATLEDLFNSATRTKSATPPGLR